jgi:hypothetical protein
MTTLPNRRRFLKTSLILGLASTGLGALPRFGSLDGDKLTEPGSLTPFLAGDDVLRLVQLSDLPKSVRQALTVNREFFHLGRAWNVVPADLDQVLNESADLWNAERGQDRGYTQFALAAGHRVAAVMADHLKAENTESGHYRDTYLMKQLQNAAPGGQQVPLEGQVDGIAPEQVAELFHLMQQRNLIRTHTLRPEFSDVKSWLNDLLTYYAAMKEENTVLAEVFCDPVPDKLERYVLAPNFYDPEDASIAAVRSLANGRVTGPVTLKLRASSAYGRALVAGLEEVRRLAATVD